MRAVLIGAGIALIAGLGYWAIETQDKAPVGEQTTEGGTAIANVTVPKALTTNAEIGRTIYDAKCAICHGADGEGQADVAPPLVHIIYEPSHHGDEAFQRAAAQGVRAHHWKFGDMPPVEGLTRGDVAMVVTYIRELQRANKIN